MKYLLPWLLLCFSLALAGSGPPWQRDSRNLLMNFNNMYQPCVVETAGKYPYKMWFFGWAAAATNPGWPGCDAIVLARSKDLKSWEVHSGKDTWDRQRPLI